MNPEKKIQIRVNTDVLRDLLDQNPEAKLELEAFAAEKIAQELVRKFIDKKGGEITQAVATLLGKEAFSPDAWSSKAKLTSEAQRLLDIAASQAITDAVGRRASEIVDEVAAKAQSRAEEDTRSRLNAIVVREREEREAFMKRLQTWWDEGAERLEAAVKDLARKEFMKVIAEVSGVFTPKSEG